MMLGATRPPVQEPSERGGGRAIQTFCSAEMALLSSCQELKAQAAQDPRKLDDAPDQTEPSKASKPGKKRKKDKGDGKKKTQ